MKIFLIKVQNYGSQIIDVICAYDNEPAAKAHIEAYEIIYAKDLGAKIWYDFVLMKSKFSD